VGGANGSKMSSSREEGEWLRRSTEKTKCPETAPPQRSFSYGREHKRKGDEKKKKKVRVKKGKVGAGKKQQRKSLPKGILEKGRDEKAQ